MRLMKLVIENYKSFQLPTEIDFTRGRSEPGRNVFLVGGMNGAGKTSILEAINICLYGEKKDRILRAINRQELARGNVSCSFEVHLEADDGKSIVAKRSWAAPASTNRPRPDDLDEKLTVIKDGQRVSVASQQVWQDYLDATIPRGITQFFFFDGEKIQEMAAEEHAELKLKASIEATLGIEFVRRLIEDLAHVRNDERRNRTDITDEDIRLKETELSILRRKQEKMTERRNELQEDVQSFTAELEDRKKRFASLFGFDPDKLDESKAKERRRVQLSTRLTEIEHDVRTWAEATLPLALMSGHFPHLREQVEGEARARRQTAIRDVADDLAETVAGEVRVFEAEERKKPLSEAEFRVLRDRIAGAVREFGPGREPQKAVKELLQLSDTDMARLLVRLEEIEKNWTGEFERLLAERQELKLQHDGLEKELRKTKVGDGDQDMFGQLQTEIENYSIQIGRKREELRQIEEELVGLADSTSTRERELDMLYQKHVGSKEQAQFLARTETIISLLSEYMERLRETRIDHLKACTTEMYKKLASKGDLISEIDIDPKTYYITIRDRSGHIVQKQTLAAGEKEVFAISLLWGLARTSQLSLPIVIDTPLSRLDSTHRDRIVTSYFPDAGHQVIVLSTDTEVDQDYYRQLEPHLQDAVHLLFDKHRELTTLEEGYFWRNE
jgi:DNA sulfur modification protein DndD